MRIISGVLGACLVLLVLVEAFEATALPRRVTRPFRFTRLFYHVTWPFWASVGDLIPPRQWRLTWLSLFGALSLALLFALWTAGLIAGFALLHRAFEPGALGFDDLLYFSGVTLTTTGYGDITPAEPPRRVLAVTEACVGVGFFAMIVSYLLLLFQAVSAREILISLLDARAGSPPAAGELLLRLVPGRGGATALDGFLERAEVWSAEVLESHLSFPMLSLYRSQHDNQSWLAALTCAIDASALLLTVVDGGNRQQARLTFATARHTLVDIVLVMRCPPVAGLGADRFPPERCRALVESLRKAGVPASDNEDALAQLAELRELYEPFAAALSRFTRLPLPDVWPERRGFDNWQTSAWMRRARHITALGSEAPDDHFR
jgi:hypothetical protein